MIHIKRYSNRKLYDTDAKRYITLEEIEKCILNGEEVRVVDHATGRNLTSLTMVQILFEREKKRHGMLPVPLLSRLIRAGDRTWNLIKGLLTTSMDTVGGVNEEIMRRIESLAENGDISSSEALKLKGLLLNQLSINQAAMAKNKSTKALDSESSEPASRETIEELKAQIDRLDSLLKESLLSQKR